MAENCTQNNFPCIKLHFLYIFSILAFVCAAMTIALIVACIVELNLHTFNYVIKNPYEAYIGAMLVTLPSSMLMLLFYFLWQRSAVLKSFDMLPIEKGLLFVRSGGILKRAGNSFANMRTLPNVWPDTAEGVWYKNPATYWQLGIGGWFVLGKIMPKLIGKNPSAEIAGLPIATLGTYLGLSLLLCGCIATMTLVRHVSAAMAHVVNNSATPTQPLFWRRG